MSEVQALIEIAKLGVGTITILIAGAIVYWVIRRESAHAAEAKDERAALMSLVGSLQKESETNRNLAERAFGLQTETNTANTATAAELKALASLQSLAISETERGIRETRENLDGVGNKVDKIVPAVEDGTGQVLLQLGTVLEELGKMKTALTDNIAQSSTSNAQLRDVFKTGLDAISAAILKIVVIDAAKAADAPKRDTEPVVQVIGMDTPESPKSTPTNGLHKVDAPTTEPPEKL